jgi:sugar (pentulose or hexulose) kinase
MSEPLVLAIDLGTQSLRITALAVDGKRRWNMRHPVETISHGVCQEQDATAWRDLLLNGLREAAAAGVIPSVILASGPLAGWVPVTASGEPGGAAVMYNDARSEADLPRVEAALPSGSIVPRLTIADPLPHALRLRRAVGRELAAVTHLLDATGWLNFVLTGKATLNAYSALRLYDAATRERLGLAAVPFGSPVEVGDVIGPLTTSLAEGLGWPRIPVIAATFDSKCAYIGSGIHATGEALDISGTVTSFGVVSSTKIIDRENRIYSVPFGDDWLVRGSTAAAGSIIEWARDTLAFSIEELDRLALERPIRGDSDPVFVPYLAGARAPLWQPQARGTITGLAIGTSRTDLARALYTGLALSVRHIIDTIVACGAPIDSIRLAGGLSRSAALAQIKADIFGRPVTMMADAELTTLGMAAIGMAHLGAYSSIRDAARALAADAATYRPKLASGEAGMLYERYVREAELSASLVPTMSSTGNKMGGRMSAA